MTEKLQYSEQEDCRRDVVYVGEFVCPCCGRTAHLARTYDVVAIDDKGEARPIAGIAFQHGEDWLAGDSCAWPERCTA